MLNRWKNRPEIVRAWSNRPIPLWFRIYVVELGVGMLLPAAVFAFLVGYGALDLLGWLG